MRTRLQDWCEQVTPDDTPFFAGGYYRDLNQTQRKKTILEGQIQIPSGPPLI